MGNTINSVIRSFYSGLKQDLVSMLPEFCLQEDFIALDQLLSVDEESTVRLMVECGKELEACLIHPARGFVTPSALIKSHVSRVLPYLFIRLWRYLFKECEMTGVLHEPIRNACELIRYYDRDELDKLTGALKAEALVVFALRQLFLAFSKTEDWDPKAKVDVEILDFVERVTHEPSLSLENEPAVFRLASLLLGSFFLERDSKDRPCLAADISQWVDNPFGMHGPGAVAGGEKGEEKWVFGDLDRIPTEIFDVGPGLDSLLKEERSPVVENTARLAIVPKDLRKHRLICIEPKEQMFAQQGLMHVLYNRIARHPLTRTAIRLTDQRRSNQMSKDLRFATIDLSDASDLLSKQLCRVLLPKEAYRVLSRYRSTSIELLDGRRIDAPINTMFTMGNALCFPTETLVFWAITVAAIYCSQHRYAMDNSVGSLFSDRFDQFWSEKLTLHGYGWTEMFADIMKINRTISVFGDDILVPNVYTEIVISCLEFAGLHVNHNKTCCDSLVRESCGSWWFAGTDVRITRCRHHMLADTSAWISLADNARELASNGLLAAAGSVLAWVNTMHPIGNFFTGIPARSERGGLPIRWNKDLQRTEMRVPTIRESGRRLRLAGSAAYYAYWTSQGSFALVTGDRKVEWTWIDAHDWYAVYTSKMGQRLRRCGLPQK